VTDDITGRTPATGNDGPASGLEDLADEVLPALVARLRASRLGEIEIRTADWRIRLRRDTTATARAAASGVGPAGVGLDALNGSVARSSAVGYFTPAPDLAVGRSVRAGDLLGTIDVLGIVQEVAAPEGGIITAVLAEDGQAVEYGQALAEVDALELDTGADALGDRA
jgi:acetyl-CoA carboxylase biotin carboxyl carrier protein